MSKFMTKVSIFLVVFGVFSPPLFGQDKDEKIKKTINEKNEKTARAMIEGDIKTQLTYYTDDVISMPNYDKMIRGKKELKLSMEEAQDEGLKFHSADFIMQELWTSGDIVCEIGTYGISLSLPGLPRPIADNGKYMTIWEKQSDGTFKVKAEIWNTDMDPTSFAQYFE